MKRSKAFTAAAKAAGMDPEEFARKVRGLLSPRKCRNTNGRRLFGAAVLKAIA